MHNQKTIVKINPEVLKWTIESAGWEIKELAKKIEIEPEFIRSWESKESPIELKKLEKIAEFLKRPLAVFFLPEPPQEAKLTDYRKISGIANEKLSKKTLDAIRNARYVQSSARELFAIQNVNDQPQVKYANLSDDPEDIASFEKRNLAFGF